MRRYLAIFVLAMFMADFALCLFDNGCESTIGTVACHACFCHAPAVKPSPAAARAGAPAPKEFIANTDSILSTRLFDKRSFHPPRPA